MTQIHAGQPIFILLHCAIAQYARLLSESFSSTNKSWSKAIFDWMFSQLCNCK